MLENVLTAKDAIILNSEIILSEITITNNKWAIFSACRPPCNSNIETFLGDLSSLLSKYLRKYNNVIIMSDFNIVKDKKNLNFDKFSEFCDAFNMSNLVKDCTCFTKTHKSSIDLILTKNIGFN